MNSALIQTLSEMNDELGCERTRKSLSVKSDSTSERDLISEFEKCMEDSEVISVIRL